MLFKKKPTTKKTPVPKKKPMSKASKNLLVKLAKKLLVKAKLAKNSPSIEYGLQKVIIDYKNRVDDWNKNPNENNIKYEAKYRKMISSKIKQNFESIINIFSDNNAKIAIKLRRDYKSKRYAEKKALAYQVKRQINSYTRKMKAFKLEFSKKLNAFKKKHRDYIKLVSLQKKNFIEGTIKKNGLSSLKLMDDYHKIKIDLKNKYEMRRSTGISKWKSEYEMHQKDYYNHLKNKRTSYHTLVKFLDNRYREFMKKELLKYRQRIKNLNKAKILYKAGLKKKLTHLTGKKLIHHHGERNILETRYKMDDKLF